MEFIGCQMIAVKMKKVDFENKPGQALMFAIHWLEYCVTCRRFNAFKTNSGKQINPTMQSD